MNLPLVLEKNTTPQNWNARREALLALFRSQEYGIRPDIFTTAKGLGGGQKSICQNAKPYGRSGISV